MYSTNLFVIHLILLKLITTNQYRFFIFVIVIKQQTIGFIDVIFSSLSHQYKMLIVREVFIGFS